MNRTGLPESKRAAMLDEVHGGFARLSTATGMRYRYTGSTEFVPMEGNSVNAPAEIVVSVVADSATTDFDLRDSALGIGGTKSWTWSGRLGEGAAIVRGYVVLDETKTASLKAGFGKGRSQGKLILHEFADLH